jgi:signal transduction histidine kinase
MAPPLRVLMVEDDERDAILMLRELQRGDYDVTYERVDTPEAMIAALEKKQWDVVLSDFTMPRFSAPEALSLLSERALNLPFIIVSGMIGEEAAVTSLRAGADDFLVKGALARLLPAIERGRRDAGVRAARKKMHEQLLVSERMASVGILAAGVAHEINNSLTILVANLALASEQLNLLAQQEAVRSATAGTDETGNGAPSSRAIGQAEVLQLLQDAQEATERIRRVVADLKVSSRSDDDERSGPVEIHRVLESSIRAASNEIRHRARLVKDYGDVPLVEGTETKLSQVFINLIVNAAQAIPEGRAEANEIRIVTRKDEAGRAVIEIHDTGTGIPQSILLHIFDAFFTTKPVNVGTGLGLAICHRIVSAYGGDLSVESQVGRGSVFRTVLPPALVRVAETASISPDVTLGRRGRILVVDDERILGVTIQRTLAGEHDVIAVTTAKEACELLSGGAQFELILCDLMMPEMTGMDLYTQMLDLLPDQAEKFVFMTGGAFTEKASRFLGQQSNPTIEKPFRPSELRDFVRSQLR